MGEALLPTCRCCVKEEVVAFTATPGKGKNEKKEKK